MARKNKRTSKRGHRRVSRNRYVLINPGHGRRLRRLMRNMATDASGLMEKLVFPALGATGGMLAAQWLGNRVAPSLLPTQDRRLLLIGSSLATAYGAYIVGSNFGLTEETQVAVAGGAGVAILLPFVPAEWKDALSLPATLVPPAPSPVATSGYYQREMLGGLMVDVSHAGAPYKGMLGLGSDPADQAAVDDVIEAAEAVSTVEPIDMALPAVSKKAVRRVRERMGTPGGRGYAGGVFARNLFSGSMG